jgi:hypothetical protein
MSETFAFAGDRAGFESKRLLATELSGRRSAFPTLGAGARGPQDQRAGKIS